jgi:subtilisin family serine protease
MRTVPFVLALALILCLPAAVGTTFTVSGPTTAPQREIVGFYEEPGLSRGDTYFGEPIVDVNRAIHFIVVETQDPALLELEARTDERVRYVEIDNPVAAILSFVPNDARYNDAGMYGVRTIGAPTAWDRSLGATSVKVGLVDSGILKTHEEFAGTGRVLQGYDFYNNDNDPDDQCGHGTHTSGTIGATINNGKGIAGLSQSTLLMAKAFTPDILGQCGGSTSALANALTYQGDQGVQVSSNSWGSSAASTTFNSAIDYAVSKGVVFVAAAGNSGSCTNCVSYPWKDRPNSVIIVSATDSADALASFSSQGPEVDIAAPGVNILSTYNDGSYTTMSGTSMATPHVAGVAALLKALHPTWGYAEIDARLKATAKDLGTAGKDDKFGYGRLDAAAATAPTTPTAPAAPTLGATAGNGQVSLSWTTPNDGGSAITGYKILRGATSGGETPYQSLGVVTSYVDTGVTNGQTYYYKVSAVNAIGTGAASNEVAKTPAANQAPTACFTHSEVGLQASLNGGCSADSDGTIASYAWTFGDSTSGTGATPSHTYAAAGTYTVTLTVTDNAGATGSASQSVTVVSDPDPGTPNLQNGVAAGASSGASGTWQYWKIQVPTGKTQLKVDLASTQSCGLLSCNPDLDLYVQQGAKPTTTTYACSPQGGTSTETCTMASPAAGYWYVGVYVYSGSASLSYTVKATYT